MVRQAHHERQIQVNIDNTTLTSRLGADLSKGKTTIFRDLLMVSFFIVTTKQCKITFVIVDLLYIAS